MRTVCNWNLTHSMEKVIKDGPVEPVSHGLCPECFEVTMAQMKGETHGSNEEKELSDPQHVPIPG